MIRRFITLGLLALPTAAAAQALGVQNDQNQTPHGAPVQIEDCTAQQGDDRGLVRRSDGRFKVVFTNEGAATADIVKFRIDYGRESMLIRDAGSFAPGVTVQHVFKQRGGTVYSIPLFDEAKLVCSVDSIHFADGSAWTASAAALATLASATAAKPKGKGYLGVQLAQTGGAVIVRFLVPAGPARLAGLQQGDVIQTIDGQQVTTTDDAVALIEASAPEIRLTIGYLRAGVAGSVSATVAAQPDTNVLGSH